MIMLRDSGIALKTYKEAKKDIGIFECNKKRIDDDTTIVYEMFDESIIETGSFAHDHDRITLWLCTASVFCKCGEYHHILSDSPVEYQILEILQNIENEYDISVKYPNKEPEESLIVYVLEKKRVPKIVEDINDWL
jgi:hypothetical protein